MIKEKQLSNRNLDFKRDTTEYLQTKYFNKKYTDYRDKIIEVLIYRDERKSNRLKRMNEVLTKKNVEYEKE